MAAWLVVGLGNPGPRYADTRHNVGAMVVGELARRHTGGTGTGPPASAPVTTTTLQDLRPHKAGAFVASVRVGTLPGGAPGPAAVLAVPGAYMNESGGPVARLVRFYGVPADSLVVVHDDLDVPAGTVRLKKGGGEGGHNGLRSISSALGTTEYCRVRVGIGRPPGRMAATDFVLRPFSATERDELPWLVGDAADAAESLVTEGLTVTQQRFHPAAREDRNR